MTPAGFFLHAWCAKTWQQGKTGQFLAARSTGLAFSAKTDGHGRTKQDHSLTVTGNRDVRHCITGK